MVDRGMLIRRRHELGLSQSQVDHICGFHRGGVSRYETGVHKPRTDFLVTLCTLYGITPNDVLEGPWSNKNE